MQERGSMMSLIKKIRVQGWLDILIFFSLSSGIGQVRLGSCSAKLDREREGRKSFLERLVSWRFLRR